MSRREETERRRLEGTKTGVPGWVRQLVERQDRTIEDLEAKVARLEAALAGDGRSSFALGSTHDPDRLPLPHRFIDQVSWQGDVEGPHGPFQLSFVDKGDHLEVSCPSGHGLSVQPWVSNVVHVFPGRRP